MVRAHIAHGDGHPGGRAEAAAGHGANLGVSRIDNGGAFAGRGAASQAEAHPFSPCAVLQLINNNAGARKTALFAPALRYGPGEVGFHR